MGLRGLCVHRWVCERVGAVGGRVGRQAGRVVLGHMGKQTGDQVCITACGRAGRREANWRSRRGERQIG